MVIPSFLAVWSHRTRGASFFLQFSHVDSDCYQRFLDEFAQQFPESLNILKVDNGRFHASKNLQIPENVILLFQPPYSPELNPIERLWQHLKADLKWASFKTLEQLQTRIDQLLHDLTPDIIASLTGYDFILDALSALDAI
ncbi:transposase [Leptolyngbya sp. GGD]|uniref:transposase n=1 Tax=Leptolyngbya sp. GGD TaxID=2997907 RepID=UPI00227B011D|nr:transposase [Leptolyngbya sp. GGD]MCY6494560.1 transposase [Leptolyngbya sp. GGD]